MAQAYGRERISCSGDRTRNVCLWSEQGEPEADLTRRGDRVGHPKKSPRLPASLFSRSHIETEGRYGSFCDLGRILAARCVESLEDCDLAATASTGEVLYQCDVGGFELEIERGEVESHVLDAGGAGERQHTDLLRKSEDQLGGASSRSLA